MTLSHNPYSLFISRATKLHLKIINRELLLIMIPHKYLEPADEPICVWCYFPYAPNLDVDILIYDTLVPLDQGVEMEGLQLLAQEVGLKA